LILKTHPMSKKLKAGGVHITKVGYTMRIIELDKTASDSNVTLLLGSNILLKMFEDSESESLLKEITVKKLLNVENLTDDKTVNALDALLRTPGLTQVTTPSRDMTPTWSMISWGSVLEKSYFEMIDDNTELEMVSSDVLERREKELLENEREVKELTGIQFLEPTVALLCPSCRRLLYIGEFRGTRTCPECKQDISRADATRLPIHKVPDTLRKAWEAGSWFEAYFAKLLRKLDWKTWTRVHIMGSSGVPHEIDALAVKSDNVIVCECKTGKTTRNDVFTFLTKTQDLKVQMGILSILGKLPETETRDFIRKNRLLFLLEDMREMKDGEIVEKLRQGLPD
jgi:hypothetical protein